MKARNDSSLGRTVREWLLCVVAVAVWFSFASAVQAQSPNFDLRIEPVGDVAMEGKTASFEAKVVLSTKDNSDPDTGVQGWTVSVAPVGLSRILTATTAGTAGARAPEGYRGETSFEQTQLTAGTNNDGAVSAVVLSFTEAITLPGDGEAVLLLLTGEADVPAGGCADSGARFRDGLKGAGQPVNNAVTFKGDTRKDDGGPQDNDRDGPESFTFQLCGEDIPEFVRGNCDGLGTINLTDAIVALNHLFLGAVIPPCLKACDTNNDQGFNLTDPIYLLNYLFLSSPPPEAPFPECGVDPTVDELPCHEPHASCIE